MKKDEIIEILCTKKGNENNTIDLNAYARGLIDMYGILEGMMNCDNYIYCSHWSKQKHGCNNCKKKFEFNLNVA